MYQKSATAANKAQENNSSAVVDIHFWGRSLVFRRPPFALSRRLLLPPRRLFHRLWSLARSPTAIRSTTACAVELWPHQPSMPSVGMHRGKRGPPSARCEQDAAARLSGHGRGLAATADTPRQVPQQLAGRPQALTSRHAGFRRQDTARAARCCTLTTKKYKKLL